MGCLVADCLFFSAGQKYYYNTKTNETSWERPRGAARTAAEASSENHSSTSNGDVSSAAINGSKFKKCLGCQGWGRGLVQAWNYCNHCTRCGSFPIVMHTTVTFSCGQILVCSCIFSCNSRVLDLSC